MKIFLTGNKGFIGSHLEKKLKELDHIVEGYDFKDREVDDVRNRSQVFGVFRRFKPDIVIHLAARTGVRESEKEPEEYITTNVWGTYNLLKAAEKYGIKNFLFASSSSVYGNQKCPLDEETVCDHQLSLYAITKKTGELLCKMFDRVPTLVFRPFTVYGEEGRKEMVIRNLIDCATNNKTFQKFGEGNSVRGYTNVHDLCDGILKLIDYKPKNNFEIFNLGGSERIKLNALISIIQKYFPKLKVEEVGVHPADVFSSYADITKANKKLGWKPIKKFKEEVEKLCSISSEI